MNYVLTNPEKERLAREVVKNNGVPHGAKADSDNVVRVAQATLYDRAKQENPKIDEEELVLYIYRGLGGRVEEYDSKKEADERANGLRVLRANLAKKDKMQ